MASYNNVDKATGAKLRVETSIYIVQVALQLTIEMVQFFKNVEKSNNWNL